MANILFLPNHPIGRAKIRIVELARALSGKNHKVAVLNWHAAEGSYTFGKRIEATLKDLFRFTSSEFIDGIEFINPPTLHRPLRFLPLFNSYFLEKVIKKGNFDTVINGSYYMFTVRNQNRNYKYVYDLADLPPIDLTDPFQKFADEQITEQIRIADIVTVISHEMIDYVKEKYNKTAYFLPNGADIDIMRSCPKSEIDLIKKNYNLSDKIVFGYIGYIGSWVNVDLVVKAFELVKKKIPNAALAWFGPAPDIDLLRNKYKNDSSIVFSGYIKGKIEPYFNALDICLLPHVESPFQDKAFHLKYIEYAAARKIVVSTRIKETMKIGFLNTLFREENIEKWADAMVEAVSIKWNKDWDSMADQYDWQNISNNILLSILNTKAKNI